MATYTDSQKERIMSYPIEGILQHFGKRTDHKGEMYFSPFREETNPSFHIRRGENVWMDFGSGEGGNVLTLVSQLQHIPIEQCWDFVAGLDQNIIIPDSTSVPSPSNHPHQARIIIDKVGDNFSYRNLVKYAESRCIPRHVLEHYCHQVTYHIESRPDTRWTAIGFPAGEGWVLRHSMDGPFAKRCTGSSCSFIGAGGEVVASPTCDRVEVFEGFFDFLSWLVIKNRTKPFSDICVLNSVNNLSKGLPFISSHRDISCWLDNDEAGRKALSILRESCPGARDHISDLGRVKDVNELLQANSKQIVSNNTLSTPLFTLKK